MQALIKNLTTKVSKDFTESAKKTFLENRFSYIKNLKLTIITHKSLLIFD